MGLSLSNLSEPPSGLIITSTGNKMKKLEYKVKPSLTEQVQNYRCFQNFPPGKRAVTQFLVKSL
jgi:hypothetical protein